MESDAGILATDPPPSTRAVPAPLVGATSSTEDTARLLKRQREVTPPSPRTLLSQSLGAIGSPAKSARLAHATGVSPPPLTGAAALEDEQRRKEEAEAAASPPASSDNPSHRVLESLLVGAAMSRPSDAPQGVPTATMDGISKPTPALAIPSDASDRFGENDDDTSPHQSIGSIAGAGVTASPTPMDVDGRTEGGMSQVAGEERQQPNSLSYPGSLEASGNMVEPGPRVMSFPIHGQTSPNPPGNKKHKCPYCNTEFTRHHNLKSHLLTHSQEKPYVCTECPLRFRRLHDLKRHGKLHTGEKPHICPKCDRKFARGDALARHSKGAGGCAGRRSSMGSFADCDEIDGNTLGEGDETTMAELYEERNDEEFRRQSMPTATSQETGGNGNDYAAHARTYPPAAQQKAQGSGLYPPNVNPSHSNSGGSSSVPNSNGGGHTPNTSMSSAQAAGANPGLYSQAGMTESPKPLSPAVAGQDSNNTNRQRSPGLSQQLQQHQLGRRQSDVPPPHVGQNQSKLPGLSHPGYATATKGGASHGRTPSGNTSDSRNMFAQSDPGVWAYINALEDRVTMLANKVTALDQEVAALKGQRTAANGEAPESP